MRSPEMARNTPKQWRVWQKTIKIQVKEGKQL